MDKPETDAPERTPLADDRVKLIHHSCERKYVQSHRGEDGKIPCPYCEVAALEQVNMDHALSLEIIGGTAKSNRDLQAEVERLRAAIGEAREFLHQPGPVGINTLHLMLDGILKGALTKPEGE